ncbi:MAG TPA: murein L,D-transpeptidase catalytic domain family protein [Puia sp.]|nr:murein L,D-transpeptidase catalytic domain family protein [Puia sp.]
MSKIFKSVLLVLGVCLALDSSLHAGSITRKNSRSVVNGIARDSRNRARKALMAEEASELYEQIDLKDAGLSKKAFQYAFTGYYYLLNHHQLANENVLTICDFSQSSRNKRLYVIDLGEKTILINTYVAHGRKTGGEFAQSFSNRTNSHKSSLGFFVTEGTYDGDNGLSLKINGVERGFNDKALRRGIVIHGSDYVGPDFLAWNKFNGRSFGCPAVPSAEIQEVVDTIKDGSCLFIYHPTKRYLIRSKILNS